MPRPPSLKRCLLGLSDLGLRLQWFDDLLGRLAATAVAHAVNRLCEENESGDLEAREALLTVALYAALNHTSPRVLELRRLADSERLLSLERLLRGHGPPSDERPMDEGRVPNYGGGRELTLGERRNLARRALRSHFDRLLSDPHPRVIAELLQNPRLTEDDVVRLAARRPGRADVLRQLAGSVRWIRQARVRTALVFNPASPPWLSVPFLGLCTRSELHELVHSTDTALLLRGVAVELLERRPPLQEANDAHLSVH